MRSEIAVWRSASRGAAAFGGILDQPLFDLQAVSQRGAYSLVVKNFGQRR